MTRCPDCRLAVPRGAVTCPHCLADRRLAGGRERREDDESTLVALGCFVYALPAVGLLAAGWVWLTGGSPAGWWLLPVVGPAALAGGYRVARAHPDGTAKLAALAAVAAVALIGRATCR